MREVLAKVQYANGRKGVYNYLAHLDSSNGLHLHIINRVNQGEVVKVEHAMAEIETEDSRGYAGVQILSFEKVKGRHLNGKGLNPESIHIGNVKGPSRKVVCEVSFITSSTRRSYDYYLNLDIVDAFQAEIIDRVVNGKETVEVLTGTANVPTGSVIINRIKPVSSAHVATSTIVSCDIRRIAAAKTVGGIDGITITGTIDTGKATVVGGKSIQIKGEDKMKNNLMNQLGKKHTGIFGMSLIGGKSAVKIQGNWVVFDAEKQTLHDVSDFVMEMDFMPGISMPVALDVLKAGDLVDLGVEGLAFILEPVKEGGNQFSVLLGDGTIKNVMGKTHALMGDKGFVVQVMNPMKGFAEGMGGDSGGGFNPMMLMAMGGFGDDKGDKDSKFESMMMMSMMSGGGMFKG